MRDLKAMLGTMLGGWQLERLLGQGAMGAVFEANRGGQRAALKVVLAGADASERVRQRFIREAKAVSRIESEYVCRSLGYGEDDGLQWLALEFIAGRDLQEVLKLRGSLTVDEALDYSRQILLGLVDAHAVGVTHRDLKPANAILTATGRVKLVDFGLARREDESMMLTAQGQILGTPYFMSPEQAVGDVADTRADLYSLGHMIYYFIVGKPAYTGRSAAEILRAHVAKTIPNVKEACPDAPAGLDRFLRKLANPEIEKRYQTSEEALAAFDKLLARSSRKGGQGRLDGGPRAPLPSPSLPRPARPSPRDGGQAAILRSREELAHAETQFDPDAATQIDAPQLSANVPSPPSMPAATMARAPAAPSTPPTRSVVTAAAARPSAGPTPGLIPEAPLGLLVGAIVAGLCWFVLTPKINLASVIERAGVTALGFAIGFFWLRGWARARNEAKRTSRLLDPSLRIETGPGPETENFMKRQQAKRMEQSGDLAGAANVRLEAGDHKEAALLFERAKRWRDAARLRVDMGQHMEAAELLCRASDRLSAARLLAERAAELEARRQHEKNPRRLARLDEDLAKVVERASALFSEEGEQREGAKLLSRIGRNRDAAELYLEIGAREDASQEYIKAGDSKRAAELYERAGDVIAAARLKAPELLRKGDKAGAARAFEEVGDLEQAARYYEEAGQLERAANLHERLEKPERAAELYERAGNHLRAAELYEQGQDPFRAGRAYEQSQQHERALASYRSVSEGTRDWGQAVRRIARLEEQGAGAPTAPAPGTRRATELPPRETPGTRRSQAMPPREPPGTRRSQILPPREPQGTRRSQILPPRAAPGTRRSQALPPREPPGTRRSQILPPREPQGTRRAQAQPPAPGAPRIPTGRSSAQRRLPPPPGPPPQRRVAPPQARPTPPRPAPPPFAPNADPARRWIGQEVDRYLVRDLLGSGAFADVFRAEHVHLERPVALKILRPEVASREEVCERFLAEAKVVSRIRHPGVVEVYDFGRAEAAPFMALELVEGHTLRAVIDQGPQPIERVVAWGKELCASLGAAHAAGVIHRDLKPENVMVDRDGRTHVMDFGMARVFWGTNRDEGVGFLGTPRYASPEAVDQGDVAAPADQYALGLILYELATGQMPFQSNSSVGWMHQHGSTPPRPPRELRPDMPIALEQALLKSLAKGAHERHLDLRAFEQALG